MSFPINTGIPAAPNNPADDQPIMRQNYANISGFLAVDHVAPGTINDGYHQQVHLLNEAAPGLGTANGVLHANIFNGQSWPYWQNALGDFLLLSGPTLASQSGFSFISQGILLQWGLNTAVSSGSFASGAANGTVTYPRAFLTKVFVVLPIPFYSTTVSDGAGSVNADNNSITSLTSFNWKFNSNSTKYTGFYWFAIGN